METFPSTVPFSYPLRTQTDRRTLVSDFESGTEQRRKIWGFPRRHVFLTCRILKQAEMKLLWDFYEDRYGAYEAFWFIVPYLDYYRNEYVGKGDGTTVIFDLPSLTTDESSLTAYVDGVDTSKTFLTGGGQAGADRIQFSAAPSANAVITADFKGKLRLKARFAIDRLNRELFTVLAYNSDVELLEVKPA